MSTAVRGPVRPPCCSFSRCRGRRQNPPRCRDPGGSHRVRPRQIRSPRVILGRSVRRQRVVLAFAEARADRVDRRQIHDVESESGQCRQAPCRRAEGPAGPAAVLALLRPLRAGEQFVPASDARSRAFHSKLERGADRVQVPQGIPLDLLGHRVLGDRREPLLGPHARRGEPLRRVRPGSCSAACASTPGPAVRTPRPARASTSTPAGIFSVASCSQVAHSSTQACT